MGGNHGAALTLLDELTSGDAPVSWRTVLHRLLHLGQRHNHLLAGCATHEIDALLHVGIEVARRAESSLRASGMTGVARVTQMAALRAILLDSPGTDPVTAAACAWGVAEGIGAAGARPIAEDFRSEQSVRLTAGSLHPRWRQDLGRKPAIVPPPYSSRPESTADLGFDRTTAFGLIPERATYIITLDWDAHDRLAPLAAAFPLRIAAGQPVVGLSDYDVTRDEGAVTNRGVSLSTHAETVIAQIEVATVEGAQVVCFGEYALTEEQRARVETLLASMTAKPVLVVGGTALVDAHPAPLNQAILWMPQGGPVFTDGGRKVCAKVTPAMIDGDHEAIGAPERNVRLFVTARHLVAVVICRDALSDELRRLLEDLGVTLLIVVAMSGKTTSLVQKTESVTATTQAVSALVNAPLSWPGVPAADRHLSMVHGPYGGIAHSMTVPSTDVPAPTTPAIHIYDVFEKTVEEFRTET